MSTTYPGLPSTNFPDSIDEIIRMSDLAAEDLVNVSLYYNYFNSGDMASAAGVLSAHPSLQNKIFNAAKFNKIMDAVVALETFYKNDVYAYMGEFSETTTYNVGNIVYVPEYGCSYIRKTAANMVLSENVVTDSAGAATIPASSPDGIEVGSLYRVTINGWSVDRVASAGESGAFVIGHDASVSNLGVTISYNEEDHEFNILFDAQTSTRLDICITEYDNERPLNGASNMSWGLITLRGAVGPQGLPGIGMVPRGAWASSAEYAQNECVTHNNALWQSLVANTDSEPNEENENWLCLVDGFILEDGAVTGEKVADGAIGTEHFASGAVAPKASVLETGRNIYVADADGTNSGISTAFNGGQDVTLSLPPTIKASISGNATTSDRWKDARTLTVKDADESNSGESTVVDGGSNVTLKLPDSIKANITGNITGNVNGDVTGNVNGNATTSTKLATARNIGSAAFDGGSDITLEQIGAMPVSGGSFYGAVSFGSQIILSSYDYGNTLPEAGTIGRVFFKTVT